jgi:P4 family phage/plasmid primase-like protien
MTMEMAPADLLPGHARELEESCIAPQVRDRRRYETLYDTEESRARLKELRIPRWAWRDPMAFPGLLMPMYRVTGEEIGHQFKPALPQEAPGGKLQKYASQTGVPNRLDVPPAVADDVRDPSSPLWITEGIKKGDCLASLGKAVITLTGVFNWRSKMGTLGDWEDIPLRGRTTVICFDSDARDNRNVLGAMQRLGRWLESKGAAVRYLIVPGEVEGTEVKGVDDFFHAGGTLEALGQASMDQLPNEARDATFTDRVLADTVCSEELDGRFRWASGRGWMQWTGKVWREATEVTVTETISRWALEQYHQAVDQQHNGTGRDLGSVVEGWRGMLSGSRVGAVLRLAKGVLECDAEAFDRDPDLMNCPNGIVDLRTGTLTPNDPDLLMTKITGAEFVKNAEHPDWAKALEALPDDVVDWFQLRVGQALTGHMTPDDTVVICQGGGENGKSTVYDGLALAAGKYHVQVSDRAMMGGATDNHPTEIMDLMGARYAVLEETPEARRLDTNRLKKLTGTREITGRRIRQDPVTFEATHTIFINSNHKPVVDETDHGTWRRLALLAWPYTFRKPGQALHGANDRPGDPTLRDRIKLDPQVQEAALAWMAAGARRWYELEKIMPEQPVRVQADTLAWRKTADLILAFATEVLEFDRDSFIASTELRSVFNDWLREKGAKEWGEKTFSARFGGHDAVTQRGVEYKIVRNGPGLSTKALNPPSGKTLRVWAGIRFSGLPPCDRGNSGESGPPQVSGPTQDHVTPVTPDPVTPLEVTHASVIPATRNRRNTILDEYGPDPFEPEPAEPAPPVLNGPVAFDLETPSAKELFTFRSGEQTPYARLNGVLDGDGKEIITTDPAELVRLLTAAPALYAHNGYRFDLMALAWHHGADYDALAAKTWDTYVDETVLDPPGAKGQKPWATEGYYGLDKALERRGEPGKTDHLPALAREFAADGLTGKAAEEDGYGKIPPDNARYNAYLSGDLKAQDRLYRTQQADPDRMEYRRREQRVAHIQNRMTLSGWKVDVPLLARCVREEADKVRESLGWLNENCGIPLTKSVGTGRGKNRTFRDEPVLSPLTTTVGREAVKAAFRDRGLPYFLETESGALALNKDALGEGSYMVGKGAAGKLLPGLLNPARMARLPGADWEAIAEMAGHIRLVTTAVQKYQEIQGFLLGDRVHAHVGETQGSRRWAMVKPSITNLGKRGGKVVQRAPFIADDGCVLIAFDFDQVDMRAFAGHCGDPEYVGMFLREEDPHSMVADMVFGRHDGDWREHAKGAGHGWNYGLSVGGMVNQGIERPLAERFDAGMNENYPVLCSWRTEVRARAADGQLLENGFGALLRCDPARAYTQAPAQIGQGTARDIMCEGLLRLPQEYVPWLRGVVHDEAVFNVPEGRVEECVERVTAAFTMDLAEITNGRLHSVPIVAGASRPGHDWASCYSKD